MTQFAKAGLLAGSCAMTMISGAACAAAPTEAAEQQAGAVQAEAEAPIAKVVVTAQRREQALQDVPAAVTAIGAAELANKQIVDVKALSANAPSLLIVDTPVG
jgi:iron complex outermembrane receptor protein